MARDGVKRLAGNIRGSQLTNCGEEPRLQFQFTCVHIHFAVHVFFREPRRALYAASNAKNGGAGLFCLLDEVIRPALDHIVLVEDLRTGCGRGIEGGEVVDEDTSPRVRVLRLPDLVTTTTSHMDLGGSESSM